MASIPGVEEARTKARTNRPDYVLKALKKTGRPQGQVSWQ